MNYYISDTHFSHENILKLCNRPFKSVEEMNDELIKRWNNKVTNNDNVYFLGDFCWSDKTEALRIINLLDGNKHFILGNHDSSIKQNDRFLKTYNYLEIDDCGTKVVLFHYPILEWNGFYKKSIHLYGHIHNSNKTQKVKNAYNVSCDVLDFEPKTLKEIIELNKIS